MIIPLGLVVGLTRIALNSRDDGEALQSESVDAARAFELDAIKQGARARELWEACTGPTGALLVLADNEWGSTEIDQVRLGGAPSDQPAMVGYREHAHPLGGGPQGLFAVCPGRHTIVTTVGGEPVRTELTVFPAEAVFRRLDRGSRTWSTIDATTQERMLERVLGDPKSLLHYYEHVGDARMKAMIGKSSEEATREVMALLAGTLAAIVGGDEEGARKRVALAARALVGAPLRTFAPITNFVGFNAFELFGKGKLREAWLLLQAGLALLHDDPTMLAALGEIQLRSGAHDEGRATLRRALERGVGLPDALRARVVELIA
jgi:hypothetical protein